MVVAACLSVLCLEPVQSAEAPYRLGTKFQPTPSTERAGEIQFQVQSPQRPANPSNPPVETPQIRNGYVTTSQPPAGLIPAKTLSAEERRQNLDILWEAIDKTYACFKLKSIDWPEVGRRYHERLDTVATTDDFYLLLFQLVSELKDTHSGLQNYNPPMLPNGPGLSVDLFDGRPFVVHVNPDSKAAGAGVKVGSEILAVDGLTIEEEMERLRPRLRARSSERACQREACWRLVAGEKGSTATVELRSPDGRTETVALKRNFGLGTGTSRT